MYKTNTSHYPVNTLLSYMPKSSPFEVEHIITHVEINIYPHGTDIVYEIYDGTEHKFIDGTTFREI